MYFNFVIIGDCVSKKNSNNVWVNKATNRPIFTRHKNYRDWEASAIKQLILQKNLLGIREPIRELLSGTFFFYRTNLRSDCSNLEEGVFDSIEKSGIVKNDNLFRWHSSELFVDKVNPRVEIIINEYMGEYQENATKLHINWAKKTELF
jgi:Holliday junction resolvase RusA-like endonuclease